MTGSDKGYVSDQTWTLGCLSWQDTELHPWTKLTSDNMKRCTFTEGDKDDHPHNSKVECHLKLKMTKWAARHLHIMALEHNTIEVVRNRLFQVPWHVLHSMTPCNKLTLQRHPEQQNGFIQMSEVATQFRVLDLCGSMCADQHTQQQTNVTACVQVSTPSNRLMC